MLLRTLATLLAMLACATFSLTLALPLADPFPAAEAAIPTWRTRTHLAKRTIGTGSLNLTRDYTLQLTQSHWAPLVGHDKTSLAAAFASAWHTACINFANTVDEHHVIDISPNQPNAAEFELFAFCGGQKKTVVGGVVNENGTGPVFDNTAGALALPANVNLVQATIIAPPLDLASCLSYKAAHPT